MSLSWLARTRCLGFLNIFATTYNLKKSKNSPYLCKVRTIEYSVWDNDHAMFFMFLSFWQEWQWTRAVQYFYIASGMSLDFL